MEKGNDMNNTVAFEDWCNYRSLVLKITVANRGGGLGFNVYFEFPESVTTTDKRCFGVLLKTVQLASLGVLIGKALNGKWRDDRSMSLSDC